ncbi:hypothetical protein VNO80_04201 [Phaseolus coccineus]|uniref:CID domain-containing protein n=1 Tax=Phaseolus coccineus TaxID=3886 RepID=A0AAN9RNK9_PHACN
MNMESTRRSLDRSREPGPKKPRLIEELSARQLSQRQQGSGAVASGVSARVRVNDRDSESSDSGRGGGYHPQSPPHNELVAQYRTALAELTFNSKPIITNLTIIAGENQSAAKAIAATVCANIIEVPSDQKLPSLYLLDSIVKNIGRDYIKYFAVRLPEVFCKAYRQVDPIVHSSMKHLFGTWKGVFPPQCLQMIEKELGFTPAVNGSASVSATVRSDFQSQRPPHSIHVNPKYLERQRLQQSSTSKGVVDDMTGALLNSNEDSERPERALGASRPWLDPRINMLNNQHAHRDAFNDSVPEKSIDGSFGGSQYGSGISSNLVSGAGRTGTKLIDLGHEKTWFKTDGGDAETISGQKNGFSLKRSLSNREAPKSINLEAHRQPRESITNIRNNVMSGNWKNSEEEEFTWDEMNTGLTDHGPNVSSNLSTDSWMTDDENLEGEDHLHILRPYGAKVDREISTVKKQLPGFGGHPPSSWQLQKHHSIDKLNLKPGYSDGFVSTISGLPANANSLPVKKGNQSFTSKALVGMAKIVGQQFDGEIESPSGQSPLQRRSPSLPGTAYHPHSMQNLPEQEMPQNIRTSQFLGGPTSQHIRDRSPTLHPIVQVGNMRRTQEKDMQGPLSSATIQPKLQQQQLDSSQIEVSAKTKLLQSKASLTKEVSEQSTKNNLSSAAVKSGIIPKKSITSNLDPRKHLSKSGVQLPRSGRSSPTTIISSGSAVASASFLDPRHKDSSSVPKKPQGKAGQPPQKLSTQPPASSNLNAAKNNVNPIANLLSSLVAKGLISAETESPTMVPSEPSKVLKGSKDKTANISTSSSFPVTSVSDSAAVPVSSARDEVDAATKSSLPSAQSTSTKIRNLIGFDFKPNLIREFHEPVIRELFDDFPHHCKICGIRFKQEEQYQRHLEWHATREHGPIKVSRSWYPKSGDWIAGKVEEYSSEFEFADSVVDNQETDSSLLDMMIRADENQCLCVLCGELFEDVYCQERNEWMFKGAVYINYSDINSEMESRNAGPIIHAKCLSENSIVTNLDND